MHGPGKAAPRCRRHGAKIAHAPNAPSTCVCMAMATRTVANSGAACWLQVRHGSQHATGVPLLYACLPALRAAAGCGRHSELLSAAATASVDDETSQGRTRSTTDAICQLSQDESLLACAAQHQCSRRQSQGQGVLKQIDAARVHPARCSPSAIRNAACHSLGALFPVPAAFPQPTCNPA